MNNVQYTIRSIPKEVDIYLRWQARNQRRSLNATVLSYIESAIKRDKIKQEDDFSWIIGSNTIDDASLKAIKDTKEYDKQKQRS